MKSLISKLWARLSTRRDPLSIMIVGLDNSGKTSILNHLASLCHEGGIVTRNQFQHRTTDLIVKESSTTSARKDHSVINSSERNIMPTVGYNYERIHYKNLAITVLDFSGQSRYRNLWQEFYDGVDGIVFVIDSSDLIRFVVVRDELETLLSHPYFGTLESADECGVAAMSPSSNFATQKQLTISQGKLVQTPLAAPSAANLSIGSRRGESGLNQDSRMGAASKSRGRRRTKVPILFLANKSDLANSVDTAAITKALNLNQLSSERHPWLVQATSVCSGQGITDAFDWLADQLWATNR